MSGPKISIDEQLAAVRDSAMIVSANAEYHNNDKALARRAVALRAAAMTLDLVRANAAEFRALLQAKKASPPPSRDLATRAAILCGDALFQKFLKVENEAEAAARVRSFCRVESRAELDRVAEAGAAWRRLDAEFAAWKRGEEPSGSQEEGSNTP